MKKRLIVILALCFLGLFGCSSNVELSATKTQGLKVEVITHPEIAILLDPITITTIVTINGTAVGEEADVILELKKKDGAVIGTVRPEMVGEGRYQIETIFDEEGVYQIVAHVTLGEEHEMPVYEINVLPEGGGNDVEK
jgi:hypothetical protein